MKKDLKSGDFVIVCILAKNQNERSDFLMGSLRHSPSKKLGGCSHVITKAMTNIKLPKDAYSENVSNDPATIILSPR